MSTGFNWSDIGKYASDALDTVGDFILGTEENPSFVTQAWNWLDEGDGLGQQLVIGGVMGVGQYLAQKDLQERQMEMENEQWNARNPRTASSGNRSGYNIAPGQGLISSIYNPEETRY